MTHRQITIGLGEYGQSITFACQEELKSKTILVNVTRRFGPGTKDQVVSFEVDNYQLLDIIDMLRGFQGRYS